MGIHVLVISRDPDLRLMIWDLFQILISVSLLIPFSDFRAFHIILAHIYRWVILQYTWASYSKRDYYIVGIIHCWYLGVTVGQDIWFILLSSTLLLSISLASHAYLSLYSTWHVTFHEILPTYSRSKFYILVPHGILWYFWLIPLTHGTLLWHVRLPIR